MKTFALDLLHDLREKRLWPVAAALLLGLVAVPVVLSKPAAEAPAPAPIAAPEPAAAELPQLKNLTVVANTAAARGGSTLDAFKAKDPFRPPAVVLNDDNDAPSVATAPRAAAAGGGGGGKTDTGGSGGGSTSPGPAPVAPRAPAPPARPRAYAFIADVHFGRSGNERHFNPLDRLGMLPNEDLPLLIFLGVDPEGNNAVFLVDSTLTTAGEGRCNPSPTECATLTIGAGSEHEFADQDGQSYTLRVNEIRRQRLTSASASASRRGRRVRASAGPRRRFVPPVLADLVTMASPGTSTSSNDGHRR